MKLIELSKRYAEALYEICKNGEMETRHNQLYLLAHQFKEEPLFKKFILTPDIDNETKENFLKKTLESFNDLPFLQFLFLLLKEDRFSLIGEIAKQFNHRLKKNFGILEAKVISVESLEPNTKEALKEKLQSYFKKTIEIHESIDPTLIGGLILVLGNQMLDLSLKDRLGTIVSRLKEVKV